MPAIPRFFRVQSFALLVCLLGAQRLLGAGASVDATAKFLAGLRVDDPLLARYTTGPVWKTHASDLDRAWKQFDDRQLSKIRAWAPPALGLAYQDTGPMYYMFSGPDFLYANAFFPNASTYILCGTEPVGPLPDISRIPQQVLPSALANLRKSLDSVLSWSFFITKNMKVDLRQMQLSGTLPILYVFLARSDCTIDSVENVALDKAGAFVPEGKGTTRGVRITFHGALGRPQTLYYFTTDLADWAIKASPNFGAFCEKQGDGVALLKAASYLMHSNNFSRVRGYLLAHSKVILQDDSGIPYRFFLNSKWDIRFYGRYQGPIKRFLPNAQPDLAKGYVEAAPPPLPFSFGYQWQPSRSSLIVAMPK